MKSRIVVVLIALLMLGTIASALRVEHARANTITVPDDYPTIQQAINGANPGDTIHVRSGEYIEHLEINKTVILKGENKNDTILKLQTVFGEWIAGIHVSASNVTIEGFTIVPASEDPTILVMFDGRGSQCYGNTLQGNILYCSYEAVDLLYSANNKILNNIIEIQREDASGIALLWDSNHNLVDGNIISGGWVDVYVDFSYYNTISYNTIINQIEQLNCGAITLFWGHNNIVKGNTIAENEIGIFVNRGEYSSTIYHNNFINNTQQVNCETGSNVAFDKGYPAGGNYWSDYTGEDLNGDGIGDTAYFIDPNNKDNYPLMSPWVRPPPLAGDLNSNEIIDLADIVILAKAYLSKPGDSNWNIHADLAPPFNEISLTDVVTLAYRYGQQAP